jgi:hypothetical protein
MSGVSLSLPHKRGFGLLIALVLLPVGACTPPQAIDRTTSSSGVDVGGVMRPGPKTSAPTPAPVPTPPADDPPKAPASIDPPSGPPSADAAAPDTAAPTTPAPATPLEEPPPAPPTADGGVPVPTPTPTPDAGTPGKTPDPVDPTLSSMPASDCKNAVAWLPDSGPYLGGEKVTHGTPKHKFECRPWPYAPWCEQIEYEPGKAGIPWVDAWIDRGICP